MKGSGHLVHYCNFSGDVKNHFESCFIPIFSWFEFCKVLFGRGSTEEVGADGGQSPLLLYSKNSENKIKNNYYT